MQKELLVFTFATIFLLSQLGKANGVLKVAKKLTVTKGKNEFQLKCPLLERKLEQHHNLTLEFDSVVWFVLGDNEMVGSAVDYDHEKYNYDPTTGELAILNVAYEDAGLYRCVVNYGKVGSRDGLVRHESSTVQLLVSQPYENLWEEEYKDNLVRALISASVTLCALTSLCALHKYRWREPKYIRHQLDELEAGNGLRNLTLELENCGRMEKIRKKQNRRQNEEISFGGSEASGCDSLPLRRSPPPPTPPPPTLVANSARVTPAVVHVTHT